MTNLTADMPLIEVPLVDQNGTINQAWFMFFVQLFRRTGGGGGSATSLTIGDVLALEETFSAASGGGDEALVQMVVAPAGADSSRMSEMVMAYAGPTAIDQMFASGTDFTPGTTTALALNTSFADAAHLWVFFDGTFQGDDQYTLSGTTLTFTDPIPVGVNKVYVKGLT